MIPPRAFPAMSDRRPDSNRPNFPASRPRAAARERSSYPARHLPASRLLEATRATDRPRSLATIWADWEGRVTSRDETYKTPRWRDPSAVRAGFGKARPRETGRPEEFFERAARFEAGVIDEPPSDLVS